MLAFHMNARAAARVALAEFGLPGNARLVKLHGMSGGVFRVELPSRPSDAAPSRLVLRLHPADREDLAQLRPRLDWLTHLRAVTGLEVPAPIRAPGGDVTV